MRREKVGDLIGWGLTLRIIKRLQCLCKRSDLGGGASHRPQVTMGCSHAGVPLHLVFTTVAGFVSDQQVCEVKAMLGRDRVLLGYFTFHSSLPGK